MHSVSILMLDRIYVQIPAYRDRELLPTLRDLFARASSPERLRVAVAWQYGDEELPLEDELRAWPQLELLKTAAAESQGCNWARRELQERWAGEEYTLFLDSHHRFVEAWDERLVELHATLEGRGVAKPIVTGYLPHYDPDRDPLGRGDSALRIRSLERARGMLFRLTGQPIPEVADRLCAEPARFVSLHLLFARGCFNREVLFDPELYFFADEVAIALRAFTHGYELWHPAAVLGWHAYDRSSRTTHWDDHGSWSERNEASLFRLRELYEGRVTGDLGIGGSRSIAEYEAQIGEPLILIGSDERGGVGKRALRWETQQRSATWKAS